MRWRQNSIIFILITTTSSFLPLNRPQGLMAGTQGIYTQARSGSKTIIQVILCVELFRAQGTVNH